MPQAIRIVDRLADQADVAISSPSNGHLLTYNSATGKWENQAAAGGGGSGNTTYTSAYASPPASPTNGDQWWPSDGAGLSAVRVSGAWQWYYQGCPITLPVDSDYSWTNQRSTTKDTGDGTVYLYAPADATDSISMRLKTIPSTPYSVIARVEMGLFNNNYAMAGLILRNSSSSNFIAFGHYSPGGGSIMHEIVDQGGSGNNITGALRDIYGLSSMWPWWKITDDGTTRRYSNSLTGRTGQWLEFYSHLHTDVITPNQIGFGLEARQATFPASVRVISWAEYASVI